MRADASERVVYAFAVVGTIRRTSALAASLLVLAAPAAAPAQTPGDEQYTDPFGGGQEEGGNEQREPEPQETPAPSQPSEPSQPEAAPPAPAPTPEPAATQSQVPNGQEQLPRTGADAGLLALGGTLLLAGGIALRVRVSEPAPRRR